MNKTLVTIFALAVTVSAIAQEKTYPEPERMRPGMTEFWTPQPKVVTPGDIRTNSAPSDAIVLFDGKNLDAWQSANGGEAKWKVHDGVFTVDKKTGVISINVKDQDPLVCKTLADSVIVRLQGFITNYRTNKARTDVAYYTALADSAHHEYVNAYMEHARYADANQHTVLESHRNKLAALENEMQLKYTSYSMLMAQLQAAQSKVQERTPAFTLLKGAAIPILPAGPKRVIFVLGMMFLVFIIRTLLILKDDLFSVADKEEK